MTAARKKLPAWPQKSVKLSPVHPNIGLIVDYQRRLERFIEEMNASILWYIRAAYRRHEPVALAQDRKSPSEYLYDIVKRLSWRWKKKLDVLAPVLAEHFAIQASKRCDASLKAAMKKAGLAIDFKLTAAQTDALNAIVGENVALIRSIASEHFTQIEGIVMRAASVGQDLHMMTNELEERFGVTRRRAAFIARDQGSKSNSVMVKTRMQEIGCTKAIWLHSGAGRHPRKSHQAFSGKEFNISEGALLDGVWTWPGHEINCRCIFRAIISGLEEFTGSATGWD